MLSIDMEHMCVHWGFSVGLALVYMKAILCRAGVEGGAAKQLMRKKGALSRYYVDSQRRNTGLNHSNVDNVLGMSVPFAAVIILTSIGSKRDKIIRFFGLRVLHDLRRYTQYRDAGPLTPRHKGAVCGDDDTPGLRGCVGAAPRRPSSCLTSSFSYSIKLWWPTRPCKGSFTTAPREATRGDVNVVT